MYNNRMCKIVGNMMKFVGKISNSISTIILIDFDVNKGNFKNLEIYTFTKNEKI